MTTTSSSQPNRIDELMVAAATQGLDTSEAAELAQAIEADPALQTEADAYELAATAIQLSMTRADAQPLPASLREKLIADASNQTTAGPAPLRLAGTQPTEQSQAASAPGFSWNDGRAFGWYTAAAALVALCIVLLQPNTSTPTGNPAPAPTLAQQYDTLVEQDGTVTASWGLAGDTSDPAYANATGQVIWNDQTQTGYMKFAGMPVNDPTKLQYQLWIVDGSRDTALENTNRVDGGVFDITAQGEVIVPIDAKLLVRKAAAFAITAETPGGVVESKGPLQLLAGVEKS